MDVGTNYWVLAAVGLGFLGVVVWQRAWRVGVAIVGATAVAGQFSDLLKQHFERPRPAFPDALIQVQRIVTLSEVHGPEAVSRLLEDLLQLQSFSADYVANLLTQRSRPRSEPAPLHLSRASDLLDLEIPPPDLSLYRTPTHE